MFVKPQIVSTPHIVAGDQATYTAACTSNYNHQGVSCQSDFKCGPYQGECIDTSYFGGIVGGIAGVIVDII
jgi:hypothetical protein